MLARYLAQRHRPLRYAMVTRDMLPSMQFGLKSLARIENLPRVLQALRDTRHGNIYAGHEGAAIEDRMGRGGLDFAHDALSDLIGRGQPDALMALLHHLHEVGGFHLPPAGVTQLSGTVPRLLQTLHAMNAQVGVAAGEPLHPLRQYTPELLHGEDAANDYLSLDPTIMNDYPEVSNLHPYLGGPGLAGLHDAHDLARMEGRTLGNYRPAPHQYLLQLIQSLHSGLTEQAGDAMRRRRQQGGGS